MRAAEEIILEAATAPVNTKATTTIYRILLAALSVDNRTFKTLNKFNALLEPDSVFMLPINKPNLVFFFIWTQIAEIQWAPAVNQRATCGPPVMDWTAVS